eukprot:1550636-Amphidinium_carterae.1
MHVAIAVRTGPVPQHPHAQLITLFQPMSRVWTPPSWAHAIRLGEAQHPGPSDPSTILQSSRGPRRYFVHVDLQSGDCLRPFVLIAYQRPNGWGSHLILTRHAALIPVKSVNYLRDGSKKMQRSLKD